MPSLAGRPRRPGPPVRLELHQGLGSGHRPRHADVLQAPRRRPRLSADGRIVPRGPRPSAAAGPNLPDLQSHRVTTWNLIQSHQKSKGETTNFFRQPSILLRLASSYIGHVIISGGCCRASPPQTSATPPCRVLDRMVRPQLHCWSKLPRGVARPLDPMFQSTICRLRCMDLPGTISAKRSLRSGEISVSLGNTGTIATKFNSNARCAANRTYYRLCATFA